MNRPYNSISDRNEVFEKAFVRIRSADINIPTFIYTGTRQQLIDDYPDACILATHPYMEKHLWVTRNDFSLIHMMVHVRELIGILKGRINRISVDKKRLRRKEQLLDFSNQSIRDRLWPYYKLACYRLPWTDSRIALVSLDSEFKTTEKPKYPPVSIGNYSIWTFDSNDDALLYKLRSLGGRLVPPVDRHQLG